MGYKIVLECTETEVGEHSTVGYHSGDQLPVGHPDAGPTWKPVIIEVPDAPPIVESPPAAAASAPEPSKPSEKTFSPTPPAAKQTGVKQ